MNQKSSWKVIITVVILLVIVGSFMIWLVIKDVNKGKDIQITERQEVVEEVQQVQIKKIGESVEGREIEVYEFGAGENEILLVGGIHGGYEWNTVVLAYEMIDYFSSRLSSIPENVKISIIPNLNPDGLFKIAQKEGRISPEDITVPESETPPGRFNANGVDLNRNFDCKWQDTAVWRGNQVGTGSEPFSEPESVAFRDYVLNNNPQAVVFWHSQANTVFGSECHGGILPSTMDIMNLYATSANYNAVPKFDAYEVTGDAEGWLATLNIPAITVELKTHQTVEFEQNLMGVFSLIGYYSNR